MRGGSLQECFLYLCLKTVGSPSLSSFSSNGRDFEGVDGVPPKYIQYSFLLNAGCPVPSYHSPNRPSYALLRCMGQWCSCGASSIKGLTRNGYFVDACSVPEFIISLRSAVRIA